MTLFALLLFPLYFAYWLLENKKPLAPFFFNAFLGVFLAAIYCAYKHFFSPFYFITPDSFWRNFLHIFIEQILLPLGVLTAAFLFVYKKDKAEYRAANVLPFYLGFYAVYLPFRILSAPLPYSAFALFAKPLLFLLMLLLVAEREKVLFVPSARALLNGRDLAFCWADFVLAPLLPAAIEALWILGARPPIAFVCVLLCCAGSVLRLAKGGARLSSDA